MYFSHYIPHIHRWHEHLILLGHKQSTTLRDHHVTNLRPNLLNWLKTRPQAVQIMNEHRALVAFAQRWVIAIKKKINKQIHYQLF